MSAAKEKGCRIAAFFDLDGTLIPRPSLEKRFFRALRRRREIPWANYFLWLAEAVRLLPHGFRAVAHANKMYLRCICNGEPTSPSEIRAEDDNASSAHTSGRPATFFAERGTSQAGGQVSATPPKRVRRNPRRFVPRFFEEALQRIAWHASSGHAIVIVSGTLEPLAHAAARELEAQLAARGLEVAIGVHATRLEEAGGKWTGKVLGDAMFGQAKARAIKQLAEELHLDLAGSYAYGDSVNDAAMLATVGKGAVVNPSRGLSRLARKRGWPMLRWQEAGALLTKEIVLREPERCA